MKEQISKTLEKEIYTAQAIFYNADALPICETQKSNTKEVGQMEMHNVTNPLWSQPKKTKNYKIIQNKILLHKKHSFRVLMLLQ